MRRRYRLLATLTLGCGLGTSAQAQYSIDWYNVEGAASSSSGGNYQLTGTAGQADAFVVPLCSDDGGAACIQPAYDLSGGFWSSTLGALDTAGCGPHLNCIFRDGFGLF